MAEGQAFLFKNSYLNNKEALEYTPPTFQPAAHS